MKLKFLGAAGTVTGSFYLLTADSGRSIIIDCGMFQGEVETEKLNYGKIEVDYDQVDGMILTHAHLDHCGRLPLLIKAGYKREIYMTSPTFDLTELSLHDTAKISKEDEKELYDDKDVEASILKFRTVEYEKQFEVGEFKVTLSDAGHILGSSFVEILVDDKKIVFSADLGNSPEDLVKPTDTVSEADYVVLESTYGNRVHRDEVASDILQSNINKIEETDGVLIIPAFSIERSQEILHKISHLKAQGKIKSETPVFFDSPMAQKATVIFEKYVEYFNREIEQDYKTINPFRFEGLNMTYSSKDSQNISQIPGAKVIIAGSGMMTGGRVVNHAQTYLPDPNNRILFVGYQGVGTLGRAIQEGRKVVTIRGNRIDVRAVVDNLESMSSHADMPRLIKWLGNIKSVKKVFLTHGEDDARRFLAQKITKDLGVTDISLPLIGDEVNI